MESSDLKDLESDQEGEFLYKEFCNFVFLGQWELARACFVNVENSKKVEKNFKQKLKGTLKNISRNPSVARNAWTTFSSPSCISFFASRMLMRITDEREGAEACVLKNIAEFCIMLEEIFSKLPQSEMKGLTQVFTSSSDAAETFEFSTSVMNVDFSSALSEETIQLISDRLFQNPTVISVFLNLLCFLNKTDIYIQFREKICSIYLLYLLRCLEQVKSSFSKNNSSNSADYIDNFCLSLSLVPEYIFDPLASNDLKQCLDEILVIIMSLCNSAVLKIDRAYQALLSRSSSVLLRYFCSKEDECFHHTLDTSVLPYSISSLNIDEGIINLRDILLLSLKTNKHLFGIFVDFSIVQILTAKFSQLENFLYNFSLARLLPLTLIFSWHSCTNDASLGNVMQAMELWKQEEEYDVLLVETCKRFLSSVAFKESCIAYFIKKCPEVSTTDIMNKGQSIFSQLQMHTPLAVIQKMFGLKHVESFETLKLLDASIAGTKEVFCHDTPVIYHDVKDHIIYRGYLAVSLVMDAILFCCELNQVVVKQDYGLLDVQYEKVDICKSGAITWNVTWKSVLKKHVSHYGMQATYTKFIIERLELAKEQIKLIYPLTFRTEILENIFSLLFLSSSDICDVSLNLLDSDEGHEDDEHANVIKILGCSVSNYNQEPISLIACNEDIKYTGRFTVNKVRQNDIFCDKKTILKMHSNKSSNSRLISTTGFLCCEVIVRDLLSVLKDAVLGVEAEFYKTRGDTLSTDNHKDSISEGISNSQDISFYVKTSVNNDKLQKRLSVLHQYINEANWRYELVKTNFIQKIKTQDVNASNQSTSFRTSHTDIKLSSLPDKAMKSSKSASDIGSSNLSSTDNFDSTHNEVRSRRKKRRHKKLFRRQGSIGDKLFLEPGIIQRMLSSPNALLRYCLWRQNFDKAMQVIGLCKLQSSTEAKELLFTEELDRVCLKIKKTLISEENFPLNNIPESQKPSTVSYIAAVARAAASGLQSTATSSVLDQEIDQKRIPLISDTIEKISVLSQSEQNMLAGSLNLYSSVLADLGYTRGFSLSHSLSLLNMSIRHWTTSVDTYDSFCHKKGSSSFIQGNIKTTQIFMPLAKEFYLFDSDVETKEGLGEIFFPHNLYLKSLSFCLVNYIGQFDRILLNKHAKFWKTFCSNLETFINLLSTDEKNVTVPSFKDIDSNFNPKNKLHSLYKKLLKSTMDLCNWSTEIVRPHSFKYVNYLNKLYVYLQQVTGALLGCKDQNISMGLTPHTSYFSSLKESPTEILRKMVVQNKIQPQKIERFASCMKVDLAHVLVDACFPAVPLNFERDYSNLCSDSNYKETQIHVLNKSAQDWASPEDPDAVARKLMTTLIEIIQDVAITTDNIGVTAIEDFQSLLKHPKFDVWANDCSELAHVDLTLLKGKEETTAFFVNVTNVAWVHALLFDISIVTQNENPDKVQSYQNTNDEKPHLSVPMTSSFFIERVMRQKALGYSIGQLGDVSLFDLRYHILHLHLPAPKHLATLPHNVLLSDPGNLNPVWLKYAPPTENKLLFVLCEGMQFSTKLEVMFSDRIDEQLNKAMEDYLNVHVTVNVNDKKIELPKLLDFYLFDFVEDKTDCTTIFEGLLILLSSFMKADAATSIKELLSLENGVFSEEKDGADGTTLPFEVKFKPLCLNSSLLLQYPKDEKATLNIPNISEFLLHPEPVVLEFLQERCAIIFNLYYFIASELETDVKDPAKVTVEDVSIVHKFSTSNICGIDGITHEMPIVQLLKQRKDMTRKPSKDLLFEWFVSALSPAPLKNFMLAEIESCFLKEQWDHALYCIDMYCDFRTEPDFCFFYIRQMLLKHMTKLELSTDDSIQDPWSYSLCMLDALCCSFIVLENIQKWPYPCAIQSLKYCLSNPRVKADKELASRLQLKLKEIEIYQKIFEASKSIGNIEGETYSLVFNNWQDVSEYSIWDQSVVIDCIKSSGLYNLSVEWAKHQVIDSRLRMNALALQIIWHLNVKPSQIDEVSAILELCTPEECVELSDIILPDLITSESKLYFIQLLLNIPLESTDELHYTNMMFGLKMLDTTKAAIKEHYYDLVIYPDLILEQLLMNMEIIDVDRAIQAILEDLKMQKFANLHISTVSINQLLEDYAFKSLELPVVDDSNVSSISNTTILDSGEVDYAVDQFIMPLCVPSKDDWVPDSRVHVCQVCSEEPFNMFSRRHHCRRCGRVVCANCSQNTLLVQGYGNSEVRVCDNCYNQTVYNTMTGSVSSPFKSSSFDKRYRILSSMKSQNLRNSPSLPTYDCLDFKRRTSSIGNNDLFHWTLTTNTEQNDVLRNQFSYDSAPSVSLCLSILKLHTNPAQCAKFMLTLCDQLINKIKPKPSGKLNTEVDFYLIISVIKSLLVNSKIKYHELQDSRGEELVDYYFRRLDIIKMLVNANCLHQIPKEDLLSMEVERKLRDHLLEEERMTLALEISTNCGLDKQSVWARWGLFCIHAGDWAAAREKFSKCLNKHLAYKNPYEVMDSSENVPDQVLKDRSKQAQESSVLKSVINCLESSKCIGIEKASAVFKVISSLEQIQNGKAAAINDALFDEKIKEECLYYLNIYGSHYSTVSFYQRHGLLTECLTYILNQKCNPEVFTMALFMPTLKCAQLSTFQHLLNANDCTLSKWWPYLINSCRHLQHLGYMNVLYQMQLFMEDYIRAAKSSINFYLAPAVSYSALFERYHFLRSAKKHFETYMKKQNESQQISYVIQNRNFLILPIKEIKSYIKTITLQEEVSHFFQQCVTQSVQTLICNANSSASLKSVSTCPPTLFGNRTEKNEIATMVLVNATKVDEGFDLAAKIVKECGLNASSVVCAAGQQLVSRQWNEQIQHFLHNVKCCFADNINIDEVIMECITCLVQQNGDVEYLIKLLSSDASKINAYLMSSKLKNAYLLAIKLHRPLDVHRIMIAAEKSGQDAVKKFCEKWLQTNAQKSKLKT